MESSVDFTYVNRLYEELRRDLEGFHKRIDEIEKVRYQEDILTMADSERPTGQEVRIGATMELIENVKSSLSSNLPQVAFRPLRNGDKAKENSSEREFFWNGFFDWVNRPVQVLSEFVDALGGCGVGIFKGAYYPWPKEDRKRQKGEDQATYLDRQQGLKRLWGPPFSLITVHPLSFYYRLGARNQIAEAIEHSYKSRRDVLDAYDLEYSDIMTRGPDLKLDVSPAGSVSGIPLPTIRATPYGFAQETQVIATEYWRAPTSKNQLGLYQFYVNGRLVFEEEDPGIKYFVAFGRTTSSKDPDKMGMSVAEIMRWNEPIINKTLTRMAEAAELLVKKRLTIELPEGSIEGMEPVGEDNSLQARTFRFDPDKVEALPAGAKVVDPFENTHNVYEAMPFVQMLMQVVSSHGVSPIFKGTPPGAGGSGYRDNSLFMMAQNQFQYLVDSYGQCLGEVIKWCEEQTVKRVGQDMWCGEHKLGPKDIKDWPCEVVVDVSPTIPTNVISQGQFYDRMHARGHITRRMVLEEGLKKGQPESIIKDRMVEDIEELLKPQLYQQVLAAVGLIPQQPATNGQGNGQQIAQLLGPDGQPINRGPGGAQQLLAGQNGQSAQDQVLSEIGHSLGGATRGGQGRAPNTLPGSTVPTGAL